MSDEGYLKSLDDICGGEGVVLYFYVDNCAPKSLAIVHELARFTPEFQACGFNVVGISGNDVAKNLFFKKRYYGSAITLLSDPGHVVGKEYGAFGVKKFFGKQYSCLISSVFLISNQEIRYSCELNSAGQVGGILKVAKAGRTSR